MRFSVAAHTLAMLILVWAFGAILLFSSWYFLLVQNAGHAEQNLYDRVAGRIAEDLVLREALPDSDTILLREVQAANPDLEAHILDSAGAVVRSSNARAVGSVVNLDPVVRILDGDSSHFVCGSVPATAIRCAAFSAARVRIQGVDRYLYITASHGLSSIVQSVAGFAQAGRDFALGLGLSLLFVVLAGLAALRSLTRELRELSRVVIRQTAGDFTEDPQMGSGEEMAALSGAVAALGRTVRLRERQIRESLAERGELVADIVHDLRRPVSVMSALLERGARSTPDGSEKSAIDEIAKLVSTEELLLSSLEEIGEPTADDAKDQGRPLDLRELTERCQQELLPLFLERGIELSIEVASGLPEVRGQASQLYRVLLNLLDNALHYSNAGDSVLLRLYEKQGLVVLEVIDSGIGIQYEDYEKILEPRYRAPEGVLMNPHGSGLGLAAVRRIIQAHGGILRIESTPGKGSTFRCLFPSEENPLLVDWGTATAPDGIQSRPPSEVPSSGSHGNPSSERHSKVWIGVSIVLGLVWLFLGLGGLSPGVSRESLFLFGFMACFVGAELGRSTNFGRALLSLLSFGTCCLVVLFARNRALEILLFFSAATASACLVFQYAQCRKRSLSSRISSLFFILLLGAVSIQGVYLGTRREPALITGAGGLTSEFVRTAVRFLDERPYPTPDPDSILERRVFQLGWLNPRMEFHLSCGGTPCGASPLFPAFDRFPSEVQRQWIADAPASGVELREGREGTEAVSRLLHRPDVVLHVAAIGSNLRFAVRKTGETYLTFFFLTSLAIILTSSVLVSVLIKWRIGKRLDGVRYDFDEVRRGRTPAVNQRPKLDEIDVLRHAVPVLSLVISHLTSTLVDDERRTLALIEWIREAFGGTVAEMRRIVAREDSATPSVLALLRLVSEQTELLRDAFDTIQMEQGVRYLEEDEFTYADLVSQAMLTIGEGGAACALPAIEACGHELFPMKGDLGLLSRGLAGFVFLAMGDGEVANGLLRISLTNSSKSVLIEITPGVLWSTKPRSATFLRAACSKAIWRAHGWEVRTERSSIQLVLNLEEHARPDPSLFRS